MPPPDIYQSNIIPQIFTAIISCGVMNYKTNGDLLNIYVLTAIASIVDN